MALSARRTLGLLLAIGLALPGCRSPEDGRPRGGGHGGDGGNYVRGRVHPPSKIDGTKDLDLLQHDNPRPREGARDEPQPSKRADGRDSPGAGAPEEPGR